jgi:hypothetical protein
MFDLTWRERAEKGNEFNVSVFKKIAAYRSFLGSLLFESAVIEGD